jgi:cystathionine gamma-synthase/methionine-gamma-lyase
MELTTRAVHAGVSGPEPAPGRPTAVPIDPSTTFAYASTAELEAVAAGAPGYMYARWANPTVAALERAVAELEGAAATVGFGSGMAALHAAVVAAGIGPGECVLCADDVYGGTIGLLRHLLIPMGVDVRFADFTRPEALDAALAGPGVKLVMAETMSNPRLRVVDVAALAAKAHAADAKLVVDATFTTPVLLRPLALGADICLHSATKYLSGHGDVLGGVVSVRQAADAALIERVRRLTGGVLGPFEAWLILRGLRTLPLRVERQSANAAKLAAFLAAHPAMEAVIYPGLAGHPDHALAERQFAGGLYGGMVAFTLKGAGRHATFAVLDRLRLCVPATSLGDVTTLVMHPATTSHRDLAPEERQRLGIGENLVRVSVGIEDARDILSDWDQALAGFEVQ